jgi:selenocysteine-specific elongation factor
MSNLIIGTAGHVDHGKTEIVRALTGKDTDRLAEEKQRGISIVLGFAPLDLGDGQTVGLVDVPGHERFVKNMVSGAVGVDLALIVIAADEGVMPQTREHFEVLRLLGVSRGVIAISKTDLVDEEMTDLVESEVRDLVRGTVFEGSPVIRTSAVTGEGVEELRSALRGQAETVREKGRIDIFRMPIDRVFTRSGIGTIVTGSVWSGEVRKGDTLLHEPAGRRVRVREVQSFDKELESAGSGQRAAIALHGVRVDEIGIGDQLITPDTLARTSMIDAAVEMSALEGSRLKNRQRIRLHHAAGEIMARAVLLDSEELEPGSHGFVQFRFEKKTIARLGDRFVLRSYSPMRVIGGGRVLDPAPDKAKRFKKGRNEFLEKLNGGDGAVVAVALAERAGTAGVYPAALVRYGFSPEAGSVALEELSESGALRKVGQSYISGDVVERTEREMHGILERFAASNRLSWGMERETLRERLGMGDAPLFDHLLRSGGEKGNIFFKGGRIRFGSGEIDLGERDVRALDALRERVRGAGFEFATKMDLQEAEPDEKRLSSFLHMLLSDGRIVRILSYGYLDREHHGMMLERLIEHFDKAEHLSVGEFKELFGFSRKFAVPILEYLDSEGYTMRVDDTRVEGRRLKEEREGIEGTDGR